MAGRAGVMGLRITRGNRDAAFRMTGRAVRIGIYHGGMVYRAMVSVKTAGMAVFAGTAAVSAAKGTVVIHYLDNTRGTGQAANRLMTCGTCIMDLVVTGGCRDIECRAAITLGAGMTICTVCRLRNCSGMITGITARVSMTLRTVSGSCIVVRRSNMVRFRYRVKGTGITISRMTG